MKIPWENLSFLDAIYCLVGSNLVERMDDSFLIKAVVNGRNKTECYCSELLFHTRRDSYIESRQITSLSL